MELDKLENHSEILIYDIESENNEPPQQTRDEPEPPRQVNHYPVEMIHTKTVTVRPIYPCHEEEPYLQEIKSEKTNAQTIEEKKEPIKEESGNEARLSKQKEENYRTRRVQQRAEPDSIIFYDEEMIKSTSSIEIDQTTRGLLNAQESSSSEEDYEEEEEDEVQELQRGDQIEQDQYHTGSYQRHHMALKGQSQKMDHLSQGTQTNAFTIEANTDKLLQQIVPINYKLRCYLLIERGLLGFAATYRLFLGEQKQFVISAKKQNFKYYSNFLISKHPNKIHKRSSQYLGRLEANFIGTEFSLLYASEKKEDLTLRITYRKNIVGFMGPRTFEVVKVNPALNPSVSSLGNLSALLQRNEHSKLLRLKTAEPIVIKGKYRLNFDGKVRIPSSKNFILEGDTLTKGNSLLFGKISEDCYMMEVAYPLSIFEAFGVCLSSLDRKILVN